jgi:cell division protein FtsB
VVSTSDSAVTAAEGDATRRAPGGLTGRAAVLGLVVCALVLSLAYPTKEFLAQRGEIGRLQDQQRQAQARVAALEEHKRRLADPAYVQAQARVRLHYVLPGETLYMVRIPSVSGADEQAKPEAPEISEGGAWYGRLWGTVRTADGSAP